MRRRTFLRMLGYGALGYCTAGISERRAVVMAGPNAEPSDRRITLFLCGDVMTGRGIDQVLPHPSQPQLYESYVKSAKGYVEIAERANGPIEAPVAFDYIWGAALGEFDRLAPDLRLINLETAVTVSENYWPGKGINYRMHPANIPCISAANIDGCILANNHVMDWGYEGLVETLETLASVDVKTAGAGRNRQEAKAPTSFEIPGKGRVLLFAYGHSSSGVPLAWQAGEDQPGVNLLSDLSDETTDRVVRQITSVKQQGDLVVVSIHWGGNWGYQIPADQQQFAHRLIDDAGVNIIHGHSSHHPKGIEIYGDCPIIYGCGDLLNDYEGIRGYGRFRDDLSLMYFVTIDVTSGRLTELEMVPMQIKRFRLQHPSEQDRLWLLQAMDRECAALGARIQSETDGGFSLAWN